MPPKPFTFILFAILWLASGCSAKRSRTLSQGLQQDRFALLALQRSISSFGRSRVAAWKSRGNPCMPKPWPHIRCQNGRVLSIDLANLGIVGLLPSQLGMLNSLTDINLENNWFTGTLPSQWGNRNRFRRLRILHLGNNLMSGSLPNRAWNTRRAFRNLQQLELQSNEFTGGLPDGWLSTANTFARLKHLDLSDNRLGFEADGDPLQAYTGASQYGWCLEGRTADSGWCPSGTISRARAPVLEVLDLSENGFSGKLPDQWGQLFPSLQFLLLHHNNFYPEVENTPGVLPDYWTRTYPPRPFRELQELVLYPSNDLICSLPSAATHGFVSVNTFDSYEVTTEGDELITADDPWFCPGATQNNPPTDLSITATLSTDVILGWKGPVDDHDMVMAKIVFGFKVTLMQRANSGQPWTPAEGWNGKVVEVFGGIDPGSGLSVASNVYTLNSGIAVTAGYQYQLTVSSYNIDGVESSPVTSAVVSAS